MSKNVAEVFPEFTGGEFEKNLQDDANLTTARRILERGTRGAWVDPG